MNLEGEDVEQPSSLQTQYAQDNAQTGKICQLTLRFRCYAQIPYIIKTAEKTFQDFLKVPALIFKDYLGMDFFLSSRTFDDFSKPVDTIF